MKNDNAGSRSRRSPTIRPHPLRAAGTRLGLGMRSQWRSITSVINHSQSCSVMT